MSLTNKVALVTGAAQGLGKAFTQHLLQCGSSVAMMDLKPDVEVTCKEFQDTFGSDKVAAFMGNITKQQEFQGVFESVKQRFGGLDIVINNAGIGGESADLWERTIDVNVKGTIRGTLLAIEHLRKDKGGRGGVIVNIASMAGINPIPCSPTYCASKSAIIHYSTSYSKHPDLLANGVRINVLAPAFVETALMTTLNDKNQNLLPALGEMIVQRSGIMQPEAVADVIMELIDEEQNKNGAVLKIALNGGKSYHPAP